MNVLTGLIRRLDGERANWERVSQAITRILETA